MRQCAKFGSLALASVRADQHIVYRFKQLGIREPRTEKTGCITRKFAERQIHVMAVGNRRPFRCSQRPEHIGRSWQVIGRRNSEAYLCGIRWLTLKHRKQIPKLSDNTLSLA